MAAYQPVAIGQAGQPPHVMTFSAPMLEWKHSLGGCCNDMNVCCDVALCAPCAIARQWDAAEGRPNSLNGWACCAGTLCGVFPCLNCALRCSIVNRFNLDEGGCMSCLIGTFFPLCGLCQQHKELGEYGLWPGGSLCSTPPPGFVMMGPTVVSPMGQPMYTQPPLGVQQQQMYMQGYAHQQQSFPMPYASQQQQQPFPVPYVSQQQQPFPVPYVSHQSAALYGHQPHFSQPPVIGYPQAYPPPPLGYQQGPIPQAQPQPPPLPQQQQSQQRS